MERAASSPGTQRKVQEGEGVYFDTKAVRHARNYTWREEGEAWAKQAFDPDATRADLMRRKVSARAPAAPRPASL